MKKLTVVLLAMTVFSGFARSIGIGPLPPGSAPDTEMVTNRAMAFGDRKARIFSFDLDLDATPSNNVQVALGSDGNGDGRLGLDEFGLVIGWDCGVWRICDPEGVELESSSPVTAETSKSLHWQACLDDGAVPRTLSVSENGVPLFPGLGPQALPYSPEWNMVRLTVRGVDAACARLRLSVRGIGFALIVR